MMASLDPHPAGIRVILLGDAIWAARATEPTGMDGDNGGILGERPLKID
jgi:hypothetical protein